MEDFHTRTRTQVSGMAGKRSPTRPLTQPARRSDLLSHSMPQASILPGQYLTSCDTIYCTKRTVYCTPGFKVLRAILKCWNAPSRTPPTSTNPRKRPLRLRGTVGSGHSSDPSPRSHKGKEEDAMLRAHAPRMVDLSGYHAWGPWSQAIRNNPRTKFF